MGRVNASVCDVGGPTMVGFDTAENVLDLTPLDWPKKGSARLA